MVKSWSSHGLIMVKSWSDHGQVMVSFDHRLIMVKSWSVLSDHGQPWSLTMNDHDHMTMVEHGWTMVPFHKHGQPWSDHGQLVVRPWLVMVGDHG